MGKFLQRLRRRKLELKARAWFAARLARDRAAAAADAGRNGAIDAAWSAACASSAVEMLQLWSM